MRLGLNALKLLLVAALIATTSCANVERQTGVSTEAQTGAAVGAAAGGLISAAAGAQTGWIVAATVLGAVAGGVIGDYLTQRDKEIAGETTHDALETNATGQTSTWQNPDSGNGGDVTMNSTYYQDDGTPCRRFTQTINARSESESGTGVACRAEDGTWQVQG